MKPPKVSPIEIRKNYLAAFAKRSEIVIESRFPHSIHKPYSEAEYPGIANAITKYPKLNWLQKQYAKLVVKHDKL